MLNDALKEEIQAAYSQLLDAKGYKARHCQKHMIAEIARTLTSEDQQVSVVEAGTGTGKTIAYAIATIPIAKLLKKKIVIATATVALQEQIIYQDLPDIRMHSGLDFSFALAKGRRRYLCLARLDQALANSGAATQTMQLFDDGGGDPVDSPLYQQMINQLGKGDWDGERDSWPEEIEQSVWSRVSTDHAQCTGRQCSHYENCYFYRARENIHKVDCIVTNQDLVLSDLMMGGGAVLPAPEESIYIFDEGHHLPDKAGNHFSHFFAVSGARGWLQQIPTSLQLAAGLVTAIKPEVIGDCERLVEDGILRLDEVVQHLRSYQDDADSQEDGWRYRFPLGRVDVGLTGQAKGLASLFFNLGTLLEDVVGDIEVQFEDAPANERDELEEWLAAFGSASSRASAAYTLWENLSHEELNPPYARWVKSYEGGALEGVDYQLSSHPVSVSEELYERLWQRCAGAVITSATISVGRDFTAFQTNSGVAATNSFASLASPFRFQEQAVLRIPSMQTDPGDANAHTEELAELIPQMLQEEVGSLVLFTSWRQMYRVHDDIDDTFRERVLMQGELSKIEIITQHKAAVDRGEASCIFGLASFAEGVDLPGDYCRHVVIAKIPFSVPDDPVGATLSEWVEERGGNSFYEVMLPNAVLRVVQAAGRLLRTETDSGVVSILDRRVVNKRYGRVILDSLPPFAREIN